MNSANCDVCGLPHGLEYDCEKIRPIQSPPVFGYVHPKTIDEFVLVYKQEYEWELDSCDRWIKWCKDQKPPDTHGINFHQGMRAALVFNNIKMGQLIRVLRREPPNV